MTLQPASNPINCTLLALTLALASGVAGAVETKGETGGAAAARRQSVPAAADTGSGVSTGVASGVGAAVAVTCREGQRSFVAGQFTLADGSAAVEVETFCLDAIEVTADAYAACVRAGACAAERLGCSNAASFVAKGKGNHPVNCVSWFDADAYCRWQGLRLPTEGEWEWAARGQGRASRYPWGDGAPGKRACWDGKGSALGKGGRQGTCPVAAHPDGDSPEGLHDLGGNVREWTASGDEGERVIRGGSWGDSIDWFLSAGFRGLNHPRERFELTGFRCAAGPLVAVPTPATTSTAGRLPAPSPFSVPAAAPAPAPAAATRGTR